MFAKGSWAGGADGAATDGAFGPVAGPGKTAMAGGAAPEIGLAMPWSQSIMGVEVGSTWKGWGFGGAAACFAPGDLPGMVGGETSWRAGSLRSSNRFLL